MVVVVGKQEPVAACGCGFPRRPAGRCRCRGPAPSCSRPCPSSRRQRGRGSAGAAPCPWPSPPRQIRPCELRGRASVPCARRRQRAEGCRAWPRSRPLRRCPPVQNWHVGPWRGRFQVLRIADLCCELPYQCGMHAPYRAVWPVCALPRPYKRQRGCEAPSQTREEKTGRAASTSLPPLQLWSPRPLWRFLFQS